MFLFCNISSPLSCPCNSCRTRINNSTSLLDNEKNGEMRICVRVSLCIKYHNFYDKTAPASPDRRRMRRPRTRRAGNHVSTLRPLCRSNAVPLHSDCQQVPVDNGICSHPYTDRRSGTVSRTLLETLLHVYMKECISHNFVTYN